MTDHFDLIVIGSGPGGYVCAIKAAQLGLKVACIEKDPTLGGTCLNVGCIPSKSLLHASKEYITARHHLSEWGIKVKDISVDLEKMLSKKKEVVRELTQGISFLFKKNKITHFQGVAKIKTPTIVTVTLQEKSREIHGKSIVIATGSSNRTLPGIDIDEKRVISSTGALSLPKIPKTMIVIGGGYIGLELGSIWNRLGSQVTVIEYADRIVPALDIEVGRELLKNLQKQGMSFLLNTKVLSMSKGKSSVSLTVENTNTQEKSSLDAETILVSVGRKPHIENLWDASLNLLQGVGGEILIDENFSTSVPGIYAIGDVVRGPMLAHKAEEEGIAVAEILAGQKGHVNYTTIPSVIYTSPEVACVGQTEEQLKEQKISYKVGKFPFAANSRAKATGKGNGFVKILSHQATDRILGVHIIGEDAGTLIAEAALAMEYKASSEDIARTCHPHPTTSEALKEAALGAFFKTVHS